MIITPSGVFCNGHYQIHNCNGMTAILKLVQIMQMLFNSAETSYVLGNFLDVSYSYSSGMRAYAVAARRRVHLATVLFRPPSGQSDARPAAFRQAST